MKTGTKIFTISYIAFVLLLVIIADLGLGKPLYDWVKIIPGSDKTGHFLLMGFISFPIHLLMKQPILRILRIPVPKGVFVIIPLILIEELSQFYFSHRNCSTLDFASDVAGVLVFGYLAVIYKHTKRRKEVC